MEGRTNFIWKCGIGAFCTCAVLAFSALESVGASKPTSTSATMATKSDRIALVIETLQRSPQRWIEVDLSDQRLIAWEGKKLVYKVTVSTGKRATPTPTGTFTVQTKLRKTRMQGKGYNVPNVPYTMFYEGNYAIHGAYWHNSFGTPVSHGCVNVTPKQARLLFNWAKVGTPVVVRK